MIAVDQTRLQIELPTEFIHVGKMTKTCSTMLPNFRRHNDYEWKNNIHYYVFNISAIVANPGTTFVSIRTRYNQFGAIRALRERHIISFKVKGDNRYLKCWYLCEGNIDCCQNGVFIS